VEKGGTAMTIFVTMTDKFMSGWGGSSGKINKYVVECSNREQADQIVSAAKLRSEMRNINIVTRFKYPPSKYVVSLRKFSELGEIWTGSVSKV
jgi:hypothetical protein